MTAKLTVIVKAKGADEAKAADAEDKKSEEKEKGFKAKPKAKHSAK